MTTKYLIGTGPTELHAHIDLDYRRRDLDPHDRSELSVVSTAHEGQHWSVVAEIRPEIVGEGR